jgi:valyl-tRNA synthetase
LQEVIQTAHETIKEYRFDMLAQALYEFTWNDYCDWYIELAKIVLNDPTSGADQQAATRYTLVAVLESLLRLLHPIIPFITEEIWQKVAPLANQHGSTIMLQPYPQSNLDLKDSDAELEINWLQQMTLAIRQIRSEMQIAPGKRLALWLREGKKSDQDNAQRHAHLLTQMARLSEIRWLSEQEEPPLAATAIVNALELYIPLAEFMDVRAESARIEKELAKISIDWERAEAKLNNPDYVAKAPTPVVEKERQRAQELSENINKLRVQLEKINNL